MRSTTSRTTSRSTRTCIMSDVRPSLLELALTFNKIAIASFGGGLSAWSREVVVVERKWMSEEEFLSALTICASCPGRIR